jgi:hypothetical protein
MTEKRRRPGILQLHRALDEARFGRDRTLNLRAMQPTVKEAEERVEAWLRERQVARVGEVLIITGRGAQSWDGVSVVREAISKRLAQLKRRGVIGEFSEHTPGSFVARLAPISALRAAPAQRAVPAPLGGGEPRTLSGLDPETRQLLRELAIRSLEELSVEASQRFVDSEMLRQLSLLAAAVPEGAGREDRLRAAIRRALDE